MVHVKQGLQKRSKKIRKKAKGYRGVSKGNLRMIIQRTEKALQYSYSHLKRKKRDFRNLWIQRINAASREHGISYSKLIHGFNMLGMKINRKVLAELAVNEPASFKSLVDEVKKTAV